jgi:hypothetical protein
VSLYQWLVPRRRRIIPSNDWDLPVPVEPVEPIIARPIYEEFEVNMMEPLVGWRCWEIIWQDKKPIFLESLNCNFKWQPNEAAEATCTFCSRPFLPHRHVTKDIPRSDCSCGIYAVDMREQVPHHPNPIAVNIAGQVYGWGRYVRNGNGWRSQFAYPKEFFLKSNQSSPEIVEFLRQFHVPIWIDTPIKLYDPREDGYENGYGEADENGDSRADQEPNTEED